MKEKENYNLNIQLNNSQDNITNMQQELGDVKTLSSQMLSMAEVPFLIDV